MSDAGFEVEFDEKARTLISRVWGVWTVEQTHRFLAAEREALGATGFMPRQIRGLIDGRRFPVQIPEVADILKNPANVMANVRRLAFLASSPEAVAQIQGTMPFSHARAFDSEEKASAFLRKLVI